MQDDHERARAYCEEALTLARELGSAGEVIMSESLDQSGPCRARSGRPRGAMASFEEALVLSRKLEKPSVMNALEGMATLAGALGEDDRAARLRELRRRRARPPASPCRPPSGRYTSPT